MFTSPGTSAWRFHGDRSLLPNFSQYLFLSAQITHTGEKKKICFLRGTKPKIWGVKGILWGSKEPSGVALPSGSGAYLGVALEAKVNHHDGREQHNGENNKHQEQIEQEDQGVHGSYQQGPGQAAAGAAGLPGKELVIHVIWGQPGDHPRLLREDFCSKVLRVLARHPSRRSTKPRSYPKKCFLAFGPAELAKVSSASSTRGQEPSTRNHRGASKENSLLLPPQHSLLPSDAFPAVSQPQSQSRSTGSLAVAFILV